MAAVKKPKKDPVPRHYTIDFETLPIQQRPDYPPAPVGVSIIPPKGKPRYYAWGHLNGNNCSWGEAQRALKEIYDSGLRVVGQNMKFDLDVAEVHMGLPIPEWQRIDDTMLLIFLDDPHQIELGLKPAAERLLGEPPEEQDELIDWLLKNQPIPGIRMTKGKQGEHYAGKYIAYAPGDLVGRYANGDTHRTTAIFQLLYPKTIERGMLAAYDRERELLPILLDMERRGIPCDLGRLKADVGKYEDVLATVNAWIIKKLKAPADINLDSGDELMAAMLAAGVADENLAHITATGKISTSKDSLMDAVSDKAFLGVMRYRAGLKTCLQTFMRPWLIEATRTGGMISTSWNQVKSPAGDKSIGTRTGRLSASRFMNMPKEFSPIFNHETQDARLRKKLPTCPIKGLPTLPWVRSYVACPDDMVMIDRDYSQQEPRILAHYDGGSLQEMYNANPWIDVHDWAKAELEKFQMFYDRKPVKTVNLGLIYGMGAGLLADKNDMSVDESKKLKEAILALYPGLKAMQKDMKLRYKAGEPIRTWGGREYYCEEPKLVKGRIVHFDYKMVNILIQGSAADCTKEAVIRFKRETVRLGKQDRWFIILTVHDQITALAPRANDEWRQAMDLLNRCMASVEFDVPMLSEGAISFSNWANLQPYDSKGKMVYAAAH